MADKRAFAKFDVGYLDNPKMLDVLDSSLHAICMHFASVLYCSQHLTDGIVAPRVMQRKIGGSDSDVQILLESGLWHAPGHSCESCKQPPAGKVYVHDFLEHNRDAAGVKRVSQVRSKAAKSRWEGEGEADANCIATCTAKEPCLQCREREKERKKEKTPSSPTAPSKEFDSFWSAYPKKVAKQAAIKAWTKAIKIADPATITAGAKRYADFTANERTEKKFIKSPDGWLSAGRWDDDITTTTQPTRASPWDQLGVHQ